MKILCVSKKSNLLGPIYIKINPKIFSYSGMNYRDIKARVKSTTGSFRHTRFIFNFMHLTSKHDVQNYSKIEIENLYSPFVYYFELINTHNIKIILYKCEFPKIFPKEDVKVINTHIYKFSFGIKS